MGSIWHDLLANFAIVAVTISLWDHLAGWLDGRWAWSKPAAMGLLFGLAAITVMLFPVAWHPGAFFDLRSTTIILAAFFGGPVAGGIAMLLAGFYRFWAGGFGMPAGLVAIAVTGFAGIAAHFIAGRRTHPLAITLAGALAALSAMSGLLAMPAGMREEALSSIALPTALLVFVSTVIAGFAMRLEARRRETEAENHIFRKLIDALPDSLNVKDRAGHFIAANPATARQMRAKNPQALIGRTDFDFYPREVAEQFRHEEMAVLASGETHMVEQRATFRDGDERLLLTLKVPLHDEAGRLQGLITHNRDITEQRKLEADLDASEKLLSRALAEMADGLAMFDAKGTLLMCNERYRSMFPRTSHLRVPGASLRAILEAVAESGEQVGTPQRDRSAWIEGVVWSLRTAGEQEAQMFDGRWLHIRTRPSGDGTAMVVVSDISVLKRAELELLGMTEQLRRLADTDGLTGLMNRRALDRSLGLELSRGRRNGKPVSLLMIDIDHFKAFNDLYGHPAGDECLKRVATILAATLKRPTDIAARYGGEEFVAVLPDTDAMGARQVAGAFMAALRNAAMTHKGAERGVVTASVGIAECNGTGDACPPQDLVARADAALYHAKQAGRDRLEVAPESGQALNGATAHPGRAAADSAADDGSRRSD